MSKLQFYVASMSLVDADGQPMPQLIEAQLNWLKDNGVDGVLLMGTNGEFPHFTVEQRQRYIETAMGLNPGLEIMVNIGAANMSDVLGLQRHALAMDGVHKILWMPPFYYPDEDLNALSEALALVLAMQPEAIPFYLYHYPRMSQVDITPELLMHSPKVRGMKDSAGDFNRIAAIMAQCPDKEIYVGTDYHIRKAHGLGTTGMISGLGNLFPKLIRQAIDHESAQVEETLRQLRQTCEQFGKCPGFKAFFNSLALVPGEQTKPMLPMKALSGQQSDQIAEQVNTILQGVTPYAAS